MRFSASAFKQLKHCVVCMHLRFHRRRRSFMFHWNSNPTTTPNRMKHYLLILTVHIFCVSLVAFRYAYMKKSRARSLFRKNQMGVNKYWHFVGKNTVRTVTVCLCKNGERMKSARLFSHQDVRRVICHICLVIISPSFLYTIFILLHQKFNHWVRYIAALKYIRLIGYVLQKSDSEQER